jgi:hypothetical protein
VLDVLPVRDRVADGDAVPVLLGVPGGVTERVDVTVGLPVFVGVGVGVELRVFVGV